MQMGRGWRFLQEMYNRWKNGEITAVAAMKELGVKKSTFYKLAQLYGEKLNIPPQTGQQNGENRSRDTAETSPGVRLQVQAVE